MCVVALAARAQDGAPSADRVRAATQQLERAFEGKQAADKLVAIKAASQVVAPAVIAWIAKGLVDSNSDVRAEAIEALGRIPHDEAFKALAQHYKAESKNLRKQERVLPKLLRAIARHGNEAALAILTDDVRAQMLQETLRARILGLATVRSKKAIDAVLALVQTIGFIEMHDHAEDLRLAMYVLTGVDRGRSVEAWKTWWAEQRESFELPPKAPQLAQVDWERWIAFWGTSVAGVERREAPPAPRER